MELDDELLHLLSGTRDEHSALDPSVLESLKRKQLSVHARRKPGVNKPRKTMLPILATRGDPTYLDRLVRLHYALSLRYIQRSDARVGVLIVKVRAELERLRGPVVDSAPVRNIARGKPSCRTLSEWQHAAETLIELLTPVVNGQLPGHEEQSAIHAGLQAFGFSPGDGWIVVTLREIEKERRHLSRKQVSDRDTEDLERSAQEVFDRVRAQLGKVLPSHVDPSLLGDILGKYAFHARGGRSDLVVGRRKAIEMLRNRNHAAADSPTGRLAR